MHDVPVTGHWSAGSCQHPRSNNIGHSGRHGRSTPQKSSGETLLRLLEAADAPRLQEEPVRGQGAAALPYIWCVFRSVLQTHVADYLGSFPLFPINIFRGIQMFHSSCFPWTEVSLMYFKHHLPGLAKSQGSQ